MAAISPSAIYQFKTNFAAGTQLSFNYAKINDDSLLLPMAESYFFYTNVIPAFKLSAEIRKPWEINRKYRWHVRGAPDITDNYWSPAVFVGAGYGNRNFYGRYTSVNLLQTRLAVSYGLMLLSLLYGLLF